MNENSRSKYECKSTKINREKMMSNFLREIVKKGTSRSPPFEGVENKLLKYKEELKTLCPINLYHKDLPSQKESRKTYIVLTEDRTFKRPLQTTVRRHLVKHTFFSDKGTTRLLTEIGNKLMLYQTTLRGT